MNLEINISKPTPLCEIMGRHKSDKGNINITQSWHNYTTVYYQLFKDMKEKPLQIFELGLGTTNTSIPNNMGPNGRLGASLYGWREFFPNAQIYGADIDTSILFKDDRIQTFYCDALNSNSIQDMWTDPILANKQFDIIIDDGLHDIDANVNFFMNTVHKLSENGIYIIEDVNLGQSWKIVLQLLKIIVPSLKIRILEITCPFNTLGDNNLVIIRKEFVI